MEENNITVVENYDSEAVETVNGGEGLSKETAFVIGSAMIAGAVVAKGATVAWKKGIKPAGKWVGSKVKSVFTKKEKEVKEEEAQPEVKIEKKEVINDFKEE